MAIEDIYALFLKSGGISTDTRKITPGSIFFALKGDKFNANEFADDALEKGASHAVIDEKAYQKTGRHLLVHDVLESLQQLARHHRRQLKIPVLGLTGSNGKTTSKELIHAVLGKKYKTFATRGNLNNHIGVPLSILAIDPSVEMAVIEMGANHVGEIALLCSIADPSHGFITNIGKAHIGTFGGFQNIVKGKTELYQHLLQRDGVVFVNTQHAELVRRADAFREKITYPNRGDYYHAELVGSDPFVAVRTETGEKVTSRLTGAYNFENIAAALCIGKFFGVPEALANQAVSEYTPGNMRSQILVKGTNTIILDAYNANPSSMEAAIENLSSMKAENKVLVLGDMFELEEEAEREHRAIGALIRRKGIRRVYLCGTLFRAALSEIPEAKYFENKSGLIAELKEHPITESTILVKASRGIGLETAVEFM